MLTGWGGFGESHSSSAAVRSCPTFQQRRAQDSGALGSEAAIPATAVIAQLELLTIPALAAGTQRKEGKKKGKEVGTTVVEAEYCTP